MKDLHRLDAFVREYPFPWSCDPYEQVPAMDAARTDPITGPTRLMNYETFLEQLRGQHRRPESRDARDPGRFVST